MSGKFGKWISAKDRLPEYGQQVLFYNRSVDDYLVSRYTRSVWWFYANKWDNGDDTFWMPLPAKPEAKK